MKQQALPQLNQRLSGRAPLARLLCDRQGDSAFLRMRRLGALLVDGVYSMRGHIPDLPALDGICRRAGLILCVDDAHGLGVFGENGGRVAEACGLSYDNLFPAVSRGKGILRISLIALHCEVDLRSLAHAFRELRDYLPKHRNPLRQVAHFAWEVGKSKVQGERYAGL